MGLNLICLDKINYFFIIKIRIYLSRKFEKFRKIQKTWFQIVPKYWCRFKDKAEANFMRV